MLHSEIFIPPIYSKHKNYDLIFTTSTTALNENGSLAAKSANTLRFSSQPLLCNMGINLEYDNSCCPTPAFNRWIHSFLMLRFLCLRPTKAYCHDFSKRLIAILKQRLARPRKPFACLITALCFILFRFRWPFTII